MKVQIGDLVQILDRTGVYQGLWLPDPYIIVESSRYIKCRSLKTGTDANRLLYEVRLFTEENIEEAHRSFEDRKKQVHEEMNNFLDKFK
tara:strand:- start:380 stop:646 length:267 start_codon:yes stop_codon:yes gene_type:complete